MFDFKIGSKLLHTSSSNDDLQMFIKSSHVYQITLSSIHVCTKHLSLYLSQWRRINQFKMSPFVLILISNLF